MCETFSFCFSKKMKKYERNIRVIQFRAYEVRDAQIMISLTNIPLTFVLCHTNFKNFLNFSEIHTQENPKAAYCFCETRNSRELWFAKKRPNGHGLRSFSSITFVICGRGASISFSCHKVSTGSKFIATYFHYLKLWCVTKKYNSSIL